jgi:hypothetical protein
MSTRPFQRSLLVLLAVLALAASASTARANHSWNNYHWARTSNPVTIRVVDSMTTSWDDNLNSALSDWDRSSVLTLVREAGDSSSTTRSRCAAVSGKVRACNYTYGNTGWLGVAQVWVSGRHITQGTAKMNDSYLASSSYSETNRQHVICQEIGHDWGLGHQDESGRDLNTCMDYANALDNPRPNQHDYDQLVAIYGGHTDSSTSARAMPAEVAQADLSAPEQWGKLVEGTHGRGIAVYVRDFGGGNRVVTHVFWAR